MVKYVLDASAILALIFQETGWERVDEVRQESAIGTVNVAEALTKLVQDGIDIEQASDEIQVLGVELVGFDTSLAKRTAELRPTTRHLGLSLGDRSCLALALRMNATAITADRSWKDLQLCPIELIR